MDKPQLVGIIAGILTAIALVPQLFKLIREKKATGVSWFMPLILITGLAGWVYYGILKEDYPIIITNAFSLVVNTCILALTIKFKNKQSSGS